MTLESSDPPEVTAPLEEGAPAPEGSTALLEGTGNAGTISAPNAVFASWTRPAARAGKMEAVKSPLRDLSCRVVCGPQTTSLQP